uniref:Uncharacterized protein n=1 Tax=Rhizophora mucronata TaxID=61149 RepID=A0A2P2NSP1_RHIMU
MHEWNATNPLYLLEKCWLITVPGILPTQPNLKIVHWLMLTANNRVLVTYGTGENVFPFPGTQVGAL